MKKIISQSAVLLFCLIVLLNLSGCATPKEPLKLKHPSATFSLIGDHVIELSTITSIDFEKSLELFEKEYGKYGCTTVGKVISNGDMIVGRSYDLSYSHSPAIVVRTAIPGHLKTIGISYNGFNGGASFDELIRRGPTEEDLLTIYNLTGDVLNEKGFYIEANMRETQPAETGIAECSGTKPGAEIRLSFAALIRYLGERASTVDEALEIADSLDVYGFRTDAYSWACGLFMADATGHYGVLELIDNRLVWNDMQQAQANFYLSPEYADRVTVGQGMGRYDVVMAGVKNVDSERDMRALIECVRYRQNLDPETCIWDPVGEIPGTVIEGKTYYIKDALDENNREYLMDYLKKKAEGEKIKTIKQRRDENYIWLSAYQTVVNCNKRTMNVVFFEDDSLSYHFTV